MEEIPLISGKALCARAEQFDRKHLAGAHNKAFVSIPPHRENLTSSHISVIFLNGVITQNYNYNQHFFCNIHT